MHIISIKSPHKEALLNISVAILLCLVGVVVYSNTFTSSFHFDDHNYIVTNVAIKKLSNLGLVWGAWSTRFISFLSFALNYRFWGLNVIAYHITNLAIHIACAFLVFWFIRLIFSTPLMKDDAKPDRSSVFIALLASLIFLTHPIQTESVVYIFQRTGLLAGFFYLFCLCLYLKYRISTQKRPSLYICSLVMALLAMFSKENTVTLPLMIILCEFYFFKTDKRIEWKYALPFLVILPIIPILLFFTKSAISSDIEKLVAPSTYSHSELYYFLTQFRVMLTYIRLSFIPINQNLDYDYPLTKTLFDLPSLVSLFVLIAIVIAAVKLFKRYKLISFSIFWFFLTILPESSLIHVKKDIIFEHWLYLPIFGYGLFLVSIAYYLFGKNFFKSIVSILLAIAACYSILTYNRNLVWRDELTLINDTIRKSPQKARPYGIRGNAYVLLGDIDKAISDYNRAIEINPNFTEVYSNRGNIYFNLGNFKEAISDYNKAIEIDSKFYPAYTNRGNIYFNLGNFKEAISNYNKAIELNPSSVLSYDNRGQAYYSLGNFNQAVSDFSKAIEIEPKYIPAYNNLGLAYFDKGDFDKAISEFNKAIEINPEYANACNNRAVSYFYKKDYDKSWKDVHAAEALGYKVNPAFLAGLKKASGREK